MKRLHELRFEVGFMTFYLVLWVFVWASPQELYYSLWIPVFRPIILAAMECVVVGRARALTMLYGIPWDLIFVGAFWFGLRKWRPSFALPSAPFWAGLIALVAGNWFLVLPALLICR